MQLTDPQKDYKTAGKKGTRNAHHCWHCITFFTMVLSQNQLAQHQNARGLRRCEATCDMTPYDSYHKYPSKAHKAWRLHDTFVSCGTCIATCLRRSRTPTCLFSQMETLHPVLFCTQYAIQQCVTICYTICIQHLTNFKYIKNPSSCIPPAGLQNVYLPPGVQAKRCPIQYRLH